jgi:MFS family permease
MAVVFVVGAYLFNLDYKLPALLSLPLITLGFILTFFLKEPYPPKKKISLADSFVHLKEGLGYFKHNYYLKYLAFFTFLIGSTLSMMLSFSSKYFEVILIPVVFIGVISFILNLISAYSSNKAHFFEGKFGEKKSIFFISLCTFLAVFFMSFLIPYFGLVFFLILAFVQGFYEVIIGDYVNRHIETSHRATMLSINNMFDNIGITLLFPLLGYFNKAHSLHFSLFLFSIFILVCCFFLIFCYKHNQHKEYTKK